MPLKHLSTLSSGPSGAWSRALVALALGAAAVGSAQANDVYWSIGVHSPGVSIGVGNGGAVIRSSPLIVYPQAPVVIYPQAVYPVGWPPGRGHWKHRHHDRDGRWEREGRWEERRWRERDDERHDHRR
jgi:hypothetical protein